MLSEAPITITSSQRIYREYETLLDNYTQFQFGQWYSVGDIISSQFLSGAYDVSNLSINSQITIWINNHNQGISNCPCRYCQQPGDDGLCN